MKVVAVSDNTGCGYYRIRQPAEALAKTEPTVEVEVVEGLPVRIDNGLIQEVAIECDVLVLQRPSDRLMPQVIPMVQRMGIKVVAEIDDDLHAMHPQNGAYWALHPRTSPGNNWHYLMQSCALADLVTVTTPALAGRYGQHGRVMVIPNYVSERLLDIPHAGDGRTVGWAGVTGSHPNDLQMTHGGVQAALGDTGAHFLCVGNGHLVQQFLNLTDEPEVTGYLDIEDYYKAVARMDVGIVPLADTRFNNSKSWLKGLEYAALGVPFVASDVAEYRFLIDKYMIGGVVKDRARDWKRNLVALLSDKEASEDVRLLQRAVVRDHLTLEGNAWRWAEAWEEALCVS